MENLELSIIQPPKPQITKQSTAKEVPIRHVPLPIRPLPPKERTVKVEEQWTKALPTLEEATAALANRWPPPIPKEVDSPVQELPIPDAVRTSNLPATPVQDPTVGPHGTAVFEGANMHKEPIADNILDEAVRSAEHNVHITQEVEALGHWRNILALMIALSVIVLGIVLLWTLNTEQTANNRTNGPTQEEQDDDTGTEPAAPRTTRSNESNVESSQGFIGNQPLRDNNADGTTRTTTQGEEVTTTTTDTAGQSDNNGGVGSADTTEYTGKGATTSDRPVQRTTTTNDSPSPTNDTARSTTTEEDTTTEPALRTTTTEGTTTRPEETTMTTIETTVTTVTDPTLVPTSVTVTVLDDTTTTVPEEETTTTEEVEPTIAP